MCNQRNNLEHCQQHGLNLPSIKELLNHTNPIQYQKKISREQALEKVRQTILPSLAILKRHTNYPLATI